MHVASSREKLELRGNKNRRSLEEFLAISESISFIGSRGRDYSRTSAGMNHALDHTSPIKQKNTSNNTCPYSSRRSHPPVPGCRKGSPNRELKEPQFDTTEG